MNEDTDNKDTIPTNLRLLFAIEEMASAGVPVTPTEVNRALGLPKPTIHRLFTTLEEEGFIQREIDGRSCSAGPRLRKMSAGILSSLRIRTARTAILTKVAAEIGETCNIALPDRDAMIYIDRVETKWPLRIQLPIGTRVPFYCTASGKQYLASLSSAHLEKYLNAINLKAHTCKTVTDPGELLGEVHKVRKLGYSTDDEEFMDSMVAVGVPITDVNGRLVSTLSFHAPVQRLPMNEALCNLPSLKTAAKNLKDILTG